jgi:phage shock protein A
MIRLIIQEMEETLVEVRSSSARIIADKKDAQRRLDRLHGDVGEWEAKATLALEKGREDLARAAVAEKQVLEEEASIIEQEFKALDEHLKQLSGEVGQLQQKLTDAKAKQKTMLMRHQTVSTRRRAKEQLSRESLQDAFDKFERYERRMDSMESEVEAMDLGKDGRSSLAGEIDSLAQDDSVNLELERLKAKLKTRTEKD